MNSQYFNPFDPTDPYFVESQENLTPEERDEVQRAAFRMAVRSALVFVMLLVLLMLVSLLSGCTTTEWSSTDYRRIETMIDRMDSLATIRTVAQQDSAWRETILRQFESIREKSDTSHTLVVDTSGKVIKETLIINNVRERNSESDRKEREVLLSRIAVLDSTLQVVSQRQLRSDSLLQSKQTIIEKKKGQSLSWWQQARLWFANLVLVLLAVLAVVWLLRKHVSSRLNAARRKS